MNTLYLLQHVSLDEASASSEIFYSQFLSSNL